MRPLFHQTLLVVTLALTNSFSARAQSVSLSGTVLENGSSSTIPGASLALMGTGRGAKANRDGNFHLALERGQRYRIRITAMGYRPDTVAIALDHDTTCMIMLRVAAIEGQMITVSADASRKEAERIMHKVIDSKDAWQSQVNNYKFQVYARSNFRRSKDTSTKIIAILESTADGYWKRDSSREGGGIYAERITARKTANIPVDINDFALFDVDNFYNDRIDVGDYSVVGPVAHDAFDRYDFDLVGEGTLNGSSVYKISVEPSSDLFPAFHGTLWIDKSDYTIAYLKLSPNDAIKLGPVKDISLIQTFSLFDNKFWMPSQLTYALAIKVQIPFVPTFFIEQDAILQNYAFNTNLNDSIFKKLHEVEPQADSVDSLHWASIREIPLATDEAQTYHTYDSTLAIKPVAGAGGGFSVTSFLQSFVDEHIYQFNRVEASHFELSKSGKLFDTWPLSASGVIGYGVGDQKWKYSATLTQGLTWTTSKAHNVTLSLSGDVQSADASMHTNVSSSLSARVYDEYVRRGVAYDPAINTLTSLLLHNDYPNYYEAKGAELRYKNTSLAPVIFSLFVKQEDQSSLSDITDKSLLLTTTHFRPNPAIYEGRVRAAGIDLNYSSSKGTWQFDPAISFIAAKQDFTSASGYTLLNAGITMEGKDAGWGRSWISLQAGSYLSGLVPPQSLFYFESRNSVLAPHDVFRTMSPLEFQGTRMAAAMLEQNFYDLPTRLIGIHLPDLYWFGFANAAVADLPHSLSISGSLPITLEHPYYEAGFGVGNIMNVLRFDAAWRLTHQLEHNFFVTGTLAINF